MDDRGGENVSGPPEAKRQLRRELAAALSAETAALIATFHTPKPEERAYAFAFVAPAEGHHIACAIATEEGLARLCGEYLARGWHSTEGDSADTVRTWMRWANPDDGWHSLRFSSALRSRWTAAFYDGPFALFDGSCERICTVALIQLRRAGAFASFRPPAIASFTYGSDPNDYVRFARRANPAEAVATLTLENAASHAASRVMKAR
jgi:hypothetical protein